MLDRKWVSLDIETIPAYAEVPEAVRPQPKYGNIKDPVKIKLAQERWVNDGGLSKAMSLNPMFASVCYVCLHDGSDTIHFSLQHQTERDLVSNVMDVLLKGREPKSIITKFGKGFDMPVLLARALLLGVVQPLDSNMYRKMYLPKYNTADTHIDLQQQPEFGDPFVTLDFLGKRILGVGKTGDGSQVAGMVERGEWTELGEYCEQDVKVAYQIAEKFQLIHTA
jgi:predicted PolB exonuclease-like 3'-5' exonuclease